MLLTKQYIWAISTAALVTTGPAAATRQPFPLGVEFYPDKPDPPSIAAPSVDPPPVLNGVLDDAAWKSAGETGPLGGRFGEIFDAKTRVRICRDAGNFYIAFECDEPRIDDIVIAAQAGEDKWPGDCIEIFFDPGMTRQSFYQFVANSVGAHNDYGPGSRMEWNGAWEVATATSDTGWTAEVRIPFSDFGLSPKEAKSKKWGFNVTREREIRLEDGSKLYELSTWAPVGASFGSPARFGRAFFATPEQLAGMVPGIRLNAALDRRVYSTLTPVAQLGIEFERGKADGSTLTVELAKRDEKQPLTAESLTALETSRMGMDFSIADLAPGSYEVRVRATNKRGEGAAPLTLPFRIEDRATAGPASGTLPLQQTGRLRRDVNAWHVRTGVPFPEGVLTDPGRMSLRVDGEKVPLQTTPLATWSKGGSIKWLGLDFQMPLKATEPARLEMRYGDGSQELDTYSPHPNPLPEGEGVTEPAGRLSVKEFDGEIVVDSGAARFAIRKRNFNLIDRMWIGGEEVVAAGLERGPYMSDEQGTVYWGHQDPESRVTIEESGPLMTVLKAEGAHVNGGKSLGRYVVRLYFYSGLEYFRVQHTFIITEDTRKTRYSDIGLLFPFGGNDYRFGLPRGVEISEAPHMDGTLTDASISLLQRSWENFIVRANQPPDLTPRLPHVRQGSSAATPVRGGQADTRLPSVAPGAKEGNLLALRSPEGEGGKPVFEGGKSPGWLGRNGFAVMVRDLWQNYPKELEATRDGLIVHMWPGHGELHDPDRKPGPDNVWRLWFAHEGRLLDFNIPENYYTEEMMKEYGFGKNGGNYGPPAKKANAIGLAKTHDMLVAFGSQAKPGAVEGLNEAFQAGIHVLADPAWICSTDAAGPLHPYDPERFPIQEEYFSMGFDYLVDVTWTMNNAYGMFNFGDSFTHIKTHTDGQEPSYYRLWAGYHHGRARVPWLLYMRSGDPKYLRWARANSMHLADVDTCHYAPTEFRTSPHWENRKEVGGLCDYKGTVHWHTGSRIGYNSMTDYMLYDYYLTGNRRMWDVLQEVGTCTVEYGNAAPQRQGAGVISAALNYYKATWDTRALVKIKNWMGRMVTKPAFEHSPPSIGWAPYIEPYIEMSGDEQTKQLLLEWADWRYSDKATVPGRYQHYTDGRALAYAYHLTGDTKYLASGWAAINLSPGVYSAPGDILSGGVNWLPYSYATQQSLYVLRPMAQLKKRPALTEIPYWAMSSGPGSSRIWKDAHQLTILYPEDTDGSFAIGGRFAEYGETTYRFLAPDGSVIEEGTIAKPEDDHHRFLIDQPADTQAGIYRLEMQAEKPFRFWYSDETGFRKQRFVVPSKDAKAGLGFDGGRWYFYVPEDCEVFRISIKGIQDRRFRTVAAAVSPDDEPHGRISLGVGENGVVEVKPPPEHRGKVWALASANVTIADVEGIERWFAARPEGAVPR